MSHRNATRQHEMNAIVPVLVLGSGITALGALRTLGRAGVPAYVIDGHDPLIRRSRWYAAPLFVVPPDVMDDLESWLPTLPFEQAVLLPCSDAWARRVSEIAPMLGARFPASTSAPQTIEILLDKGRFAEVLGHSGTPHPYSAVIESVADLDSVPESVFASAFLKPRDSQRFFQVFGKKALHVRSSAEAAEHARRLEAMDLSVILQEYIPGPASNHYFIDGFIDRHGIRQSVLARRRLRMYPLDFGNSSYMVSVPLDEASGAVESVTRLLGGIGYRGMFSAEFKLDPRDGTFKLLEVNARAWWYVEYAARCGVDVCTQAYHDALERPVQHIAQYRVGVPCVYPYYDINACRALRRQGELTSWSWARSWVGAMQPVFQLTDPLPAMGAAAELLIGRWRRSALASIPAAHTSQPALPVERVR